MSRNVNAVLFDRAGSKAKRKTIALHYASWNAHIAARKPLDASAPDEPARMFQLDYAAWHARLVAAERKAA